MFFIRKEADHQTTLSPQQHQEFLKGCETYIGQLKADGKLIAAQPIDRKGIILSNDGGEWKETAFNEVPEVIGGYYHILATDLNEAISIAKRNPEFAYPTGARIEVRPIKMKEQSTGFVYPK